MAFIKYSYNFIRELCLQKCFMPICVWFLRSDNFHFENLDLSAAVQQNLFTYMLDLVTIAFRLVGFSLRKHNDKDF